LVNRANYYWPRKIAHEDHRSWWAALVRHRGAAPRPGDEIDHFRGEDATTALPPTKEEIEKPLAVAPRYGIEIKLPGDRQCKASGSYYANRKREDAGRGTV
jgi:hypothetical protein